MLVSSKKFNVLTLSMVSVVLIIIALYTIIIDPFFHYHKPLENLNYPFLYEDEYYINNGIARNFEYDAIITGSSMTTNFECSQFDELFSVNSVKISADGQVLKMANENLVEAFRRNNDIKLVLRSIDSTLLVKEKDFIGTNNFSYPMYLYNDNIFDDVNYLFNRNVIFEKNVKILNNGNLQYGSSSFDMYGNWGSGNTFGRDAVIASYNRPTVASEVFGVTQMHIDMMLENLEYNVISVIDSNPNTTFLLFVPPYSICYWDEVVREKRLDYTLSIQKLAVESFFEYPNVKVYDFSDAYDVITNLDNYKDKMHYGKWINAYIIDEISKDNHRVTIENCDEYYEGLKAFYNAYDYEVIYQ